MAPPNEVVQLPNGGFAGFNISRPRLKKLTRRYVARMWPVRSHRPRSPRSPRSRRSNVRTTAAASRDGPGLADDDDSESDHVARPQLSRAEHDYLRVEVDRRVRLGIAAREVEDKALFRAVEAWGEAEVVA
jgi:hypothetical protein